MSRSPRFSNRSRLLLKQPTRVWHDNEEKLNPKKLKQLVNELESERNEFIKVKQHLIENIDSIYKENESLKNAIIDRQASYELILDQLSKSIQILDTAKNHNKKMTKKYKSYKLRVRKLQRLNSNYFNYNAEMEKFQQEIDDIQINASLLMKKFPNSEKKAHNYQILLSLLSKLMRINELFTKEAENCIEKNESNPSLFKPRISSQINDLEAKIDQRNVVKSELPLVENDSDLLIAPKSDIIKLSKKLEKCVPIYNQILRINDSKSFNKESDNEETTNSSLNYTFLSSNSPLASPRSQKSDSENLVFDDNNSFIRKSVTTKEEVKELRRIIKDDDFYYLTDQRANDLKQSLQLLFNLYNNNSKRVTKSSLKETRPQFLLEKDNNNSSDLIMKSDRNKSEHLSENNNNNSDQIIRSDKHRSEHLSGRDNNDNSDRIMISDKYRSEHLSGRDNNNNSDQILRSDRNKSEHLSGKNNDDSDQIMRSDKHRSEHLSRRDNNNDNSDQIMKSDRNKSEHLSERDKNSEKVTFLDEILKSDKSKSGRFSEKEKESEKQKSSIDQKVSNSNDDRTMQQNSEEENRFERSSKSSEKCSKSEKFYLPTKSASHRSTEGEDVNHDTNDQISTENSGEPLIDLDQINMEIAKSSLKSFNSFKSVNSVQDNGFDNSAKGGSVKSLKLNSEHASSSEKVDNFDGSDRSSTKRTHSQNSNQSERSKLSQNSMHHSKSQKSEFNENDSNESKQNVNRLNSNELNENLNSKTSNNQLSVDHLTSLLKDNSQKKNIDEALEKSKKANLVDVKTNTGFSLQMIRDRINEQRMKIEEARNSRVNKYDRSVFYESNISPQKTKISQKHRATIKLTVTLKDIGLEGLDSSTPDKTQELKKYEIERKSKNTEKKKKTKK